MELGVITDSDVRAEMLSRGITIIAPGVTTPMEPVSPVVTVPPPSEPQQPVIVSPGQPDDYYEPYAPFYPPAVIYPQDVEEEEVAPYVTPDRPVKSGLNVGLIVVLGITAFALVSLAKPKTPQRSQRPIRRGSFTRRR
jgi:CBS domain-containing protein